MKSQEDDNPLSHIKKFEICKGDATKELKNYLKNPETIVSLAYFDLDIYEPTKECLKLIKPRLTKGSVIGFDELNDPDSPGETLALIETLGLNNIRLKDTGLHLECHFLLLNNNLMNKLKNKRYLSLAFPEWLVLI